MVDILATITIRYILNDIMNCEGTFLDLCRKMHNAGESVIIIGGKRQEIGLHFIYRSQRGIFCSNWGGRSKKEG